MKRSWFEQYLSLEHRIPSYDTFGRVFSLIDPEQFQACFSNLIKGIVKTVTGDVIAIDGKCLRRSHDKSSNKSAIYMVSAWSHYNQLTKLPHLANRSPKEVNINGYLITHNKQLRFPISSLYLI
jgi:hypothetical protein